MFWHRRDDPEELRTLLRLKLELDELRGEKIMADLTALKAAVAKLATDSAAGSAAIIAALSAEPAQADVDALTASVTTADGQINAAAAAVPATPAPAPAPAPVSTQGTSGPAAFAPNS